MKTFYSLNLKLLHLGENTYILNLRTKLMMPHIFLKGTPPSIIINVFDTCVVPLWFANTNMQFILEPYTTASYCTSYMTKINKSIKLKFHL